MNPNPETRSRSGDIERGAAIVLRTVHLAAVVALGAALLGAPVAPGPAAIAALASGVMLAALDLVAGRVRLDELAGAVVVAKLAVVAWMGLASPGADRVLAAFWLLLAVSSLSAHAPKALRHWRPGRGDKRDSKADRPG
jgi:hypothetical protein